MSQSKPCVANTLPPRAVLFDLGETLIRFPVVDLVATYNEGARRVHEYLRSIGFRPVELRPFQKRYLRIIYRARFWSLLSRRDFDSITVMGRAFVRGGMTLTPEQLARAGWLWYEPLWEISRVEPDATETLAAVAALGLKLALVSNTIVSARILDEHLARAGLLEYFPVRVYSCQTGYRKPDRRIFSAALDQIGVRAEEAIYVGDTPKADVLGARRAGMMSVYKSERPLPRGIRPDYAIRRLAEALPIVEALLSGKPRGPAAGS